jgi:antitoxin component HigA of HigAB toxin-antitoxin module
MSEEDQKDLEGPAREHGEKLKRIDELLQSPDVRELDALTAEVEAYEKERFPIAAPTLSEAMKFRRDQMGESPEEISQRAGMPPWIWKRLEAGEWSPSITEARKLHAVGISASVLLGPSNEAPTRPARREDQPKDTL